MELWILELGRIQLTCGCKLIHQSSEQTLQTVTIPEKRFWWLSQPCACSALQYPCTSGTKKGQKLCNWQAHPECFRRRVFIRMERTRTWKVWRERFKKICSFFLEFLEEEKDTTHCCFPVAVVNSCPESDHKSDGTWGEPRGVPVPSPPWVC